MFLVDSFKTSFAEVSTLAVHFGLIMGVAAYTLFGALSMQYLESPQRVRSQLKRDVSSFLDNSAIDLSGLPDRVSRVYLGQELALIDPEIHKCLEATIVSIFSQTQCDDHTLDHLNIDSIDRCYIKANVPTPVEFMKNKEKQVVVKEKKEEAEAPVENAVTEKWSIGNSVIFAFTVITTIGYGHVAPETFEGRLFCIFYGLIGVPFTLLTIADLGMFLTKVLRSILQLARKSAYKVLKFFQKRKNKETTIIKNSEIWATEKAGSMRTAREPSENGEKIEKDEVNEGGEEEEPEEEGAAEPRKTEESIALGITFTCYLIAGAKILSVYEPEMNFFNALYFNFVTLTTIGLGDFVPKSFDYLFVTLVYIGIGLALTTMAIEIAADLLKQIHYAGRKMENVASAVVWFGGKKMTMKSLVKHLGDQFNIPEEELANLDMTKFVDEAIKVEKGEIGTLRKPPTPPVVFRDRAFSYSNLRKSSELKYVDDSRVSKATDLTVVHESTRTMDTLQGLVGGLSSDDRTVPRLDLDVHYFADMSAPTSFDEQYLRTFSHARRK